MEPDMSKWSKIVVKHVVAVTKTDSNSTRSFKTYVVNRHLRGTLHVSLLRSGRWSKSLRRTPAGSIRTSRSARLPRRDLPESYRAKQAPLLLIGAMINYLSQATSFTLVELLNELPIKHQLLLQRMVFQGSL